MKTKAPPISTATTAVERDESIEYRQRRFTPAAPGVMLMTGRVLMRGRPRESHGVPLLLDLNYLAVWRNEKGTWRFLAWQSCRNPGGTRP